MELRGLKPGPIRPIGTRSCPRADLRRATALLTAATTMCSLSGPGSKLDESRFLHTSAASFGARAHGHAKNARAASNGKHAALGQGPKIK